MTSMMKVYKVVYQVDVGDEPQKEFFVRYDDAKEFVSMLVNDLNDGAPLFFSDILPVYVFDL